MAKRILLLLLIIPLAWNFGAGMVQLLEFVFPVIGAFVAFLIPDPAGKDATFYARFFIAILGFWALLWIGFLLLGFLLPQAQQYGNTKLLRRIHGISAEVLMVLLFAGVLVAGRAASEQDRPAISRVAAATYSNYNIQNHNAFRGDFAPLEARLVAEGDKENIAKEIDFKKAQWLDTIRRLTTADAAVLYGNNRYTADYRPGVYLEWAQFARNRFALNPAGRRELEQSIGISLDTYLQERENVLSNFEKDISAQEELLRLANLGTAQQEIDATIASIRANRLGTLAWDEARASTPIYLFYVARVAWRDVLFRGLIFYVLFGRFAKNGIAFLYGRVINFLQRGRMGRGGSARLATLVEEWPLRWRPASEFAGFWKKFRADKGSAAPPLFMGRSMYNPLLHVGLGGDQHMMTIAGSRTGKGRTAIIPNLLTWEGSAIVIDPKGTNAAVTANARRKMGQDVHIVDPFNVVGKESARFNVFDLLEEDNARTWSMIDALADALVVPERSDRGAHFEQGGRDLLSGYIAQLRTEEKSPSLPMVLDWMLLPDKERAALWSRMQLNQNVGGGAARFAAQTLEQGIGVEEVSNYVNNARKNVRWLSDPAIAAVLKNSTFSIKELRQKPTTIYIVLPLFALVNHIRLLRLFVNMVIKDISAHGRSKVPVLAIVDEFLTMGHMREIEQAFVFAAGYNLILWPFAQDYGQLKQLYANSVSSFVTNSRALQVFGVTDPETTAFISKQMGKRSMQRVWGMGQLRSELFREPDEVAKEISRAEGFEYILRNGEAPLLLEKVPYDEHVNDRLDDPKASVAARLAWWATHKRYPFAGRYDRDPDYRK